MKNRILIFAIMALFAGAVLVPVVQAKEDNRDASSQEDEALVSDKDSDLGDLEEAVNSLDSTSTKPEVEDKDKNEVEDADKPGDLGDEHKSEVATFVQSLLKVADRNGNMGSEVREIAREQASSTDKVVEAVDKVEKRSKVLTFLFGTDYKNLGQIRSELRNMDNRIEKLKSESEKLSWEAGNLDPEITTLEAEKSKLEDFIKTNEERFSLLGWAVKLFAQ